jgi:hypothetical protein
MVSGLAINWLKQMAIRMLKIRSLKVSSQQFPINIIKKDC